jgi:predicted ATP-dependent endonuclease of OLD family
MYTALRIQNFRLFEDLELNDLGRVNLIAGKNNTGKTRVLDVIAILNREYMQTGSDALRLQVNGSVLPFETLFCDFEVKKTSVFHAKLPLYEIWLGVFMQLSKISLVARNGSVSLQDAVCFSYRWSPNPNSPQNAEYYVFVSEENQLKSMFESGNLTAEPFLHVIQYIKNSPEATTVEAESFTQLVKLAGKRQMLVDALKTIDNRLNGIELLAPKGIPLVYVDLGLSQLVPISTVGEGFRRLLNFLVAIGNTENGIVLIDEIENGLHYSVLTDVWKAIGKASRDFNVQVFATTHSHECIEAAQEAFKDSEPNDFRYHRLQRSKEGVIRAVTYTSERLEDALEAEFEVR